MHSSKPGKNPQLNYDNLFRQNRDALLEQASAVRDAIQQEASGFQAELGVNIQLGQRAMANVEAEAVTIHERLVALLAPVIEPLWSRARDSRYSAGYRVDDALAGLLLAAAQEETGETLPLGQALCAAGGWQIVAAYLDTSEAALYDHEALFPKEAVAKHFQQARDILLELRNQGLIQAVYTQTLGAWRKAVEDLGHAYVAVMADIPDVETFAARFSDAEHLAADRDHVALQQSLNAINEASQGIAQRSTAFAGWLEEERSLFVADKDKLAAQCGAYRHREELVQAEYRSQESAWQNYQRFTKNHNGLTPEQFPLQIAIGGRDWREPEISARTVPLGKFPNSYLTLYIRDHGHKLRGNASGYAFESMGGFTSDENKEFKPLSNLDDHFDRIYDCSFWGEDYFGHARWVSRSGVKIKGLTLKRAFSASLEKEPTRELYVPGSYMLYPLSGIPEHCRSTPPDVDAIRERFYSVEYATGLHMGGSHASALTHIPGIGGILARRLESPCFVGINQQEEREAHQTANTGHFRAR